MSKLIITLDTADVTHQDVVDALYEVARRITSYVPDHDELNGVATYNFSDMIEAKRIYADLLACLNDGEKALISSGTDLQILLKALDKAYNVAPDEEDDND